ncbi:hypothetical protein SAMN05444396_110119 [Flavobacterium segetis]|uniref:Uncharacterized protein n=1 Tax=Flavobacterium segetis TaxID=271157 RepID=A0A1M5JEJ2_9FLAO|nr:hypothetical protein SAMN05444396_110119 [Flavobacterium segetis]
MDFISNPEAWSEGIHYKNHYVYNAKKRGILAS